jgi:PKHD-type hydroxylase
MKITPFDYAQFSLPYYLCFDNLFTTDELSNIETYCDKLKVHQATIDVNTPDKSRNCLINLCAVDKENTWLFDKLLNVSKFVNDNGFNFELAGFHYFQYTKYNGLGTQYDFHSDMRMDNYPTMSDVASRKLSFSLVLSDNNDYEGGEFQIKHPWGDYLETVPQTKGRIIAFPSFMIHRVSALTSGVRKSVVFWALGPRFK